LFEGIRAAKALGEQIRGMITLSKGITAMIAIGKEIGTVYSSKLILSPVPL
jgi:hypothetical protein